MHTQATLVAFYGPKPEALASLVRDLQTTIKAEVGAAFVPYALEQAHATIIGLEATAADVRLNANTAKRHASPPRMDLAAYLRLLRQEDLLPVDLQLAGFEDRPYPFESRGESPYRRSFSVQGELVVLVGWPVEGGSPLDPTYPDTLDRIRRTAQSFHITHQYHRAPDDFDNDLYLRLGELDRGVVDEPAARHLEDTLRTHLSELGPTRLRLRCEDLSIVSFRDPTLPWPDCEQLPLVDVDLDADLFELLYRPLDRDRCSV